ncbi:TlpA disulfide reductase family protein [Neptunicella marina]|uniref:TlpA family protein disulfide reductase n=1 Tax=Neptunicella marina TaxID=2125989 RepID=A0A8J6IY71_9ALTE|nr:TlpA disulfide reductase family protein [Neptunicella marina]MBC3767520.1 TlpA family protein disulfide reductase [Neptunicella marina]
MIRAVVFLCVLLFQPVSFAQTATDFLLHSPNLPDKLSDLKGKVVYVDFWASWCAPCRLSFPWMEKMYQQHKDDGLIVIAINLDNDSEQAKKFLSSIQPSFAIEYDPDGDIAQQYKLTGMPSSYVIDKQGQIRFKHQGFFVNKQQAYEQELTTLLNEME